MFQCFPFTNAHQLNLDWILETLKTFPRTVNNTYPDEDGNINLPTVAGMSSWNGIGADGAGNVDPAEHISDLDNAAEGFHIYHWTDPDDLNIPTDATWFPSGEGYCISCANAGGYICQISNGLGQHTIATREKNPGDPWSSWRYFNNQTPVDLSSNITLNVAVVDTDEPSTVSAYVINGWAFVYIECASIAAVGLGDTIASGLPLPANPGPPCYVWGAIQDVNTTEIKPCRYIIGPSGLLEFSYLGNCDNAHDVISLVATYPVA